MKSPNNTRLLQPPVNCWRLSHAERLAFLIDGAAYFRAFREAVCQARHSVLILSWDIDTRLRLIRDGEPDAFPEALGDFLYALVRLRRDLRIHILNWDWALLYALERQWMPLYKIQWRRHPRLHFHLDDQYPFGASQHQKVVVIDDQLAFVGGLDLCKNRWDTPDHTPNDARRVNADQEAYRPFHDVQLLVSGEAAADLGALARERWRRATGKTLRAPPKRDDRPWPPSVTPDLADQTVAIARTEAFPDGRETVREVECLYLEAIASAQRFLYIENQYLSSWRIGEALTQRLREPEGPEIVIVLPLKTGDWLEQHTMDVLRSRLLRRLREADHHRRLRVYYPQHQPLGKEYISLHGKLMVVDDFLLLVGSANLSNRSMGFDSECNLAIEALDDRSRQAVMNFRHRLLAEHLGAAPETVAARIADTDSLIGGVESLRGGRRSLEPLEGAVPDLADELLPDREVVDPEKPVTAEQLADRLIPEEERRSVRQQMAPILAILVTLLGLAAAWRWTPLGDWLNATVLVDAIQGLSSHAGAPFFMIAAYLIGGFIAVPVTLLIMVTVLTFGPWPGVGLALVGAELSALATFGIGHGLGRSWVRRFAGRRVNQLSRRLAQRGILTMTALRIVPVAPFTVVNLVAGASHIRFRDFAMGSLLGLIPGTLAIAVFTDQVAATIRQPDLPAFAVLAGVAGGLVVGLWALRRWIRRRGKTSL
ncbi:MAG: VTT domain-containing protein [Candidatus Competibacteraceae bacterium]|nr:VTT domain-containing protein [Candidatus Competibacteraceae bacterium]MCB1793518.1 VTT domain-containing protein [Candidatus Competibacteraceae bacterium]HRX71229.1 VTT domain-containing protein [Candidatus Competibacteraceae bacterium]